MSAPHPEESSGLDDDPRDDRALMSDHLAGDRGAFPLLVNRHRRRLWTVALRSLRDREEAADALQDGVVRAYRYAHSYRGDAEVGSWMRSVMVRVCLDRVKARGRTAGQVPLEDQEERPREFASPGDAYGVVDAQLSVAQLLSRLPDEQRLPLLLVDVEQYSVTQAAEMLGVPTGTVKSRCARGRARLAEALRAQSRAADADGGDPNALRSRGGGGHGRS